MFEFKGGEERGREEGKNQVGRDGGKDAEMEGKVN